MKKILGCFIAAIITLPAAALDIGNGFSIGGGVKTGIMVKNSDFTGSLKGVDLSKEYPMTLYFASKDNDAYKGEGWLEFGYSSEKDWGLKLSLWSHGDLNSFSDAVHLGDYYAWANLLDNRLRFIGGNGGGTPITSGGWLDADWLGYTGLRFFWVDPLGFSIGINFVNPDDGAKAEGIKPVNYLSMISYGAGYRYGKFWVTLMFDNTPIYDDTEASRDGGLHRPADQKPIGQGGNIAFGVGVNDIFWGKGIVAFDGIIANLGEDDVDSLGSGDYKISPVVTTLALKAGTPIPSLEDLYVELKMKYQISQGDNATDTASATRGKLEFEPYTSYVVNEMLKAEFSFNVTSYINSYYLALDYFQFRARRTFFAGQNPPYSWAYDIYSPWEFFVKPAVIFEFKGIKAILGYEGAFSRDHAENTLYLDLRWSF